MENIDSNISDISHCNVLADTPPRAREIMENINKWDYIKLKSFCMAKETTIKMKRVATIRENIFANDTSEKSLISKIYELLI